MRDQFLSSFFAREGGGPTNFTLVKGKKMQHARLFNVDCLTGISIKTFFIVNNMGKYNQKILN